MSFRETGQPEAAAGVALNRRALVARLAAAGFAAPAIASILAADSTTHAQDATPEATPRPPRAPRKS